MSINSNLDVEFSMCIYVRICNQGFYLAKCYFESRTLIYGIQVIKYDTGLFPIFQCTRIDIPLESAWNYLECRALTFIATYQTIFTQEFTSELLNTCYETQGTIFNPTWSHTKC